MTLDQLLNHPLLSLPIDWKKEGYESYNDTVNIISQSYLKLLDELDEAAITGTVEYIGAIDKKSLLLVSEKVAKAISKSLDIYLNQGNPFLAAQVLREAFLYQPDLPNAQQPNYCIGTFPLYPRQYRIRITKACDSWGIFHAPFEIRQNVGTSRYSVPGYPTLYLSRSVLTAYREMGPKPYEEVFVSKFEFTAKDHHSEYLVDMMNRPTLDNLGDIYRYLARWPLLMACNMKVSVPDAVFKQEYILPQMVFQWVKEKYKVGGRPIAGVRYPSTKIEPSDESMQSFHANTAIPVREVNLNGYCPVITRMFNWTTPRSFADLLSEVLPADDIEVASSGWVNERYERYQSSEFGHIENRLGDTPFHR